MIKGLMGSGGVVVDNGNTSLPWTSSNDGDTYQGMLRLRGGDIQYYDKGIWNTLPTSYATVKLDGSTEHLLQWVREKQKEDLAFKAVIADHHHPAVRNAQKNLEDAMNAVKKAEEQLKITATLARDTYEGNEAEVMQAP
jgi:hypothetical protein